MLKLRLRVFLSRHTIDEYSFGRLRRRVGRGWPDVTCYAAAGTLPPRRLALRRDAASASTSRPAPVTLPAALLPGARAGGGLPARIAAGAVAGAPARSSGGGAGLTARPAAGSAAVGRG